MYFRTTEAILIKRLKLFTLKTKVNTSKNVNLMKQKYL